MEQQHNELYSDSVNESSAMSKGFVFNCPYLGTIEDSDTSLAYPASANHCFRVSSPTGVDVSHQEAYCLTDQHPNCHVFQMASIEIADVEPVTPEAAPEKSKRRVSLYAFPLILILILLAAIIWWPAPGTTIQESLVLGAQNNKEINGGATLNGKPDSSPAQAKETVEDTSPDDVAEPTTGATLNDSGTGSETGDAEVSSDAEAGNKSADTVQPKTSPAANVEPLPEPPAEEAKLVEDNSESTTGADQTTIDEASVETEISSEEASPDDADQNTATTSSAAASSFAVSEESTRDLTSEELSESDKDNEESEAVVTTDLPIMSSDAVADTPTSVEPDSTDAATDLTTLVGPAAGTILSLRDSTEDVNALSVYQEPTSDSLLLSLIEQRQFVTLLGRDGSGSWLNVLLNDGVEGWINLAQSGARVDVNNLAFNDDTSASDPAAEQPVPVASSYPVIRSATVDTGALNVRTGPGVGYEAITVINSGDVIGLIGRRALGPWVRVRLESGTEGWVNSSLLAQVD